LLFVWGAEGVSEKEALFQQLLNQRGIILPNNGDVDISNLNRERVLEEEEKGILHNLTRNW